MSAALVKRLPGILRKWTLFSLRLSLLLAFIVVLFACVRASYYSDYFEWYQCRWDTKDIVCIRRSMEFGTSGVAGTEEISVIPRDPDLGDAFYKRELPATKRYKHFNGLGARDPYALGQFENFRFGSGIVRYNMASAVKSKMTETVAVIRYWHLLLGTGIILMASMALPRIFRRSNVVGFPVRPLKNGDIDNI